MKSISVITAASFGLIACNSVNGPSQGGGVFGPISADGCTDGVVGSNTCVARGEQFCAARELDTLAVSVGVDDATREVIDYYVNCIPGKATQ